MGGFLYPCVLTTVDCLLSQSPESPLLLNCQITGDRYVKTYGSHRLR